MFCDRVEQSLRCTCTMYVLQSESGVVNWLEKLRGSSIKSQYRVCCSWSGVGLPEDESACTCCDCTIVLLMT